MKLAMLSWRYLGHPQAGGAETMSHEILRRAVARGHEVTCFTAMYSAASRTDTLDGVRLFRAGRQWTVHAHAFRWLRSRLDSFDRVIDQVNTIPFLTPLYAPAEKRRLFIHQLAKEYWFRETRGLFRLAAPFGYLAEPWALKLYRSTPAIVHSESTMDDLVALGLPRDRITIVPHGLTFDPLASLEDKSGPFRAIIVGRLTPAKFVEEGIDAFARVKDGLPEATLDVLGSGETEYRARLESMVVARGIEKDVTFHGFVDEERKREMLKRAHVHVFTSHREGWGLTVTEAAAMGTPSVGYAVPGVRDSIAEPRLLAESGSPAALAERIHALRGDPRVYERLRVEAWKRSHALSYEATTDTFLEALY